MIDSLTLEGKQKHIHKKKHAKNYNLSLRDKRFSFDGIIINSTINILLNIRTKKVIMDILDEYSGKLVQ